MKTLNRTLMMKLTRAAYSAGVVSLIVGILLSLTAQPVLAVPEDPGNGNPNNTQEATQTSTPDVPGAPGTPGSDTGPGSEGNENKIWICHAPPATPAGWTVNYVDESGWGGHSHHPGDFIITSASDPACTKPAESTATSTSTPTLTATPGEEEKVTICHVAEAQWVIITISQSALITHEDHHEDFVINSEEDAARCAAPEPSETPEPTATNTPTETPTNTPTNTPTMTPTSTEVPDARLSLDWMCLGDQQQWTVSNPNPFAVAFSWSISGSGSSGSVPANSSLSFYTAPGYHTLTINWTDSSNTPRSLSMTTSENSPCPEVSTTLTATPGRPERTPPPQGEPTVVIPVTGGQPPVKAAAVLPTFVSTLAPVDPNAELLIPVTGAEQSNPLQGTTLASLFLQFGFVFLGMAFVSHGIVIKVKA